MTMTAIRNILFIMADQLRWDYLSCYGHPHLHTPNIDALAERGVRFDRAFVQSPVCGPSRASFYTGRAVFSHGSTWNNVPLPIGELTLGDYLRPTGMRTAVVGKTHMVPDSEGMARLGLNPETEIGAIVQEPGFKPFERDDGLHPTPLLRKKGKVLRYNEWLRAKGYDGENPWDEWANSAQGPDGEILSGWDLRHSNLAARVAEEHSETAYMTDRAIDFITESGERPWLCHLSYIKPHWPYIAPAPYHALYGLDSFVPVLRDPSEWASAHPVQLAFMDSPVSKTFARDEVRETVLPAYMGLIKQIDDHLGRLFAMLEQTGRLSDTMIVFTSDHGDYMGDHYMGEKELFHEVSVRVPLIIVDPRTEADVTRGTSCDLLVEGIDLVPTFLEATGAPVPMHRLEGRSLMPLLKGTKPEDWRSAVFSEIDYAAYPARGALNVPASQARGYMIRDERWKYVHFRGFRPQLFDLHSDPNEFNDLGDDPTHAEVCAWLKGMLVERLLSRKNRVTISDEAITQMGQGFAKMGIKIGQW
jgi:arylsulfatase A-like enzyme